MDNTAPATLDKAPEFQSILLTFDHTTAPRANGSILQKFVGSTEDMLTAVLALVNYYGEGELLTLRGNLDLIQKCATSEFPAMVYSTPENIQVIFPADTFALLVEERGSFLNMATFVGQTLEAILTQFGDKQVPPLLFLALGLEVVKDVETDLDVLIDAADAAKAGIANGPAIDVA